MIVCLLCHKAWDNENIIEPNSDKFWRNIKTAHMTFCGTCRKRVGDEFESQFRTRLRLEGKK